MQLHYLDFDFTDEESGRGSFDAMASVVPARLPYLLSELCAVLGWATDTFGPAGALGDDSAWDYALHAEAESGTPLDIGYDERTGEVALDPIAGAARTTVTLTLTGSAAFCEAFRTAFDLGE
jgi:hypothetical protein